MENDEIIVTCYLIGNRRLHQQRVVAVYFDESVEMYISSEDMILGQLDFPYGFGDGFVWKLLVEFGREKTGGFIADLMQTGIRELIKFTELLQKDPHAEPHPPENMVSPEYQYIYAYLFIAYKFSFAYHVCLIILEMGMRLATSIDMSVYNHWMYTTLQ